jgi:Na+-driven multidrug efflux pump
MDHNLLNGISAGKDTITAKGKLLSNTLLNYVFVFGKFGALALGVSRSALAINLKIPRLIKYIKFILYMVKYIMYLKSWEMVLWKITKKLLYR